MANERTVKIKFTGESKGLAGAAKQAESTMSKFGRNVSNGIASTLVNIPKTIMGVVDTIPSVAKPLAVALLGGLAATMAPMIGAALTSAVLLGVGGGVLALGIKAALEDPKIKAAFKEFKERAKTYFQDFGKPFQEPVLRAFKTFDTALKGLKPSFDRLATMIAPVIDRLAPALAKFAQNAMPGIEAAVKSAVPLFNTLADKLPRIGVAARLFFEKIAGSGYETNQFWGDLLELIAGLIVALGAAIAKLASWYVKTKEFVRKAQLSFAEFRVAALREMGKLLDGAVAAMGWIPGIGPKLRDAQGKFREFQASANRELNKLRDRTIRINVWSNVGAVVNDIANKLNSIPNAKPVGKRAAGGPVSAGRTYLVGEKGPELLTMGASSGHITPNHELGQGGGGTYYAMIDLGKGVSEVVKLEFKQMKREARMAGGY